MSNNVSKPMDLKLKYLKKQYIVKGVKIKDTLTTVENTFSML